MNIRGALSWLGLLPDNDAYDPGKIAESQSDLDQLDDNDYPSESPVAASPVASIPNPVKVVSSAEVSSSAEVAEQLKPGPINPSATSPVAGSYSQASAPSARRASVTPAVPQLVADIAKIVNLKPRSYTESAKIVGENFREGAPVIINMAEMEDGEAKQLLAFAAGLVFALDGKLERINKMVFVLSPASIMIANSDKQRIADGFYSQN